MTEFDPTGRDQHQPGAKLDGGKIRAGLVLEGFQRALMAVAAVGTYGATRYTPKGWEAVPEGQERYRDAMWRHLLAEGNDESGLPHAWHHAWNVLATLELQLRAEEAQ